VEHSQPGAGQRCRVETQYDSKSVIKSANGGARWYEMARNMKVRMAGKKSNAAMGQGGKSGRLAVNGQNGSGVDDGTRQDCFGVGADEFFC
jgi:hypothetical protein